MRNCVMEEIYTTIQKICSKYPRPEKFSDPGGDFSEEELSELIRKQDSDLTEGDLMCIFSGCVACRRIPRSHVFSADCLAAYC